VSSNVSFAQEKRRLVREYATATNGEGLWQALTTFVPLVALGVAMALLAGPHPWLAAALGLPLTLVFIRVFSLMHDSGHGSLFRSKALNRGFGFAFGVLAGMPQYVWSQRHAYHHKTNGDWERFRGPLTTLSTAEYDALSDAQRRRWRRSRSLVLAPLGGFIYLAFNPRFNWLRGNLAMLWQVLRDRTGFAAHRSRYWKSWREYRHMTGNNLVLLTLWSFAWQLPGAFFATYLAALSIAGGVGIALFTVQHNFENAYASDTAHWDADAGCLDGTSFLVLPGWLNWVTANIGYHHVHHLSSSIPLYRLRECHEQNAGLFTGVRRIRLTEVPGHLNYLLWDRDAGRIVSIVEHDRRRAAA
jgi:omega-6 fatty acid desaturase (delta-12 desaturase)